MADDGQKHAQVFESHEGLTINAQEVGEVHTLPVLQLQITLLGPHFLEFVGHPFLLLLFLHLPSLFTRPTNMSKPQPQEEASS